MTGEGAAKAVDQYVLKAVLAAASVVISVCSWLVKDKVGEISSDIKDMGKVIQVMQTNNALAAQQIASNGIRIDQAYVQMDRHQYRLQALETFATRAALKAGMEFHSPAP